MRQQKEPATLSSLPAEIYVSLIPAAVACILRPTNVIVWATVSITLLCMNGKVIKILQLAQTTIMCGIAVVAASVAMDRSFYGTWVFPPLRFVYFNVVQSLAVFYGKNRHDYYLTEGLPLLLTTALPFAAIAVFQALRAVLGSPNATAKGGEEIRFVLALSVLTSVAALTLISHKEVRFIYPLLPMLHVLAAKPLATFFHPFPIPVKR